MKHISKIATIALICSAFALTISITLAYQYFVGWDGWFHLNIAKIYAKGELGMFSSYVLDTIHYPYPPLFHLLLVPSVWLGQGISFLRVLQLGLYPIGLLSSAWLLRKTVDWRTSMITVTLLMGSIAFFDRLFQPIPQSFDMILFPLAFLFYLKGKYHNFVLVSLAMIFTHGFASVALLGGICLHALATKHKKWIAILAAYSLPIIIPSILYIAGGWGFWGESTTNTPQELWFWTAPLSFSTWYLGVLTVALLVVPYLITKWKQLSTLEHVSLLTLLSLLPMIIPWPDRFLTYITLPLAYLFAMQISRLKQKFRYGVYPFLAVGWLVFQLVLWSWLFMDNFYVVSGI